MGAAGPERLVSVLAGLLDLGEQLPLVADPGAPQALFGVRQILLWLIWPRRAGPFDFACITPQFGWREQLSQSLIAIAFGALMPRTALLPVAAITRTVTLSLMRMDSPMRRMRTSISISFRLMRGGAGELVQTRSRGTPWLLTALHGASLSTVDNVWLGSSGGKRSLVVARLAMARLWADGRPACLCRGGRSGTKPRAGGAPA